MSDMVRVPPECSGISMEKEISSSSRKKSRSRSKPTIVAYKEKYEQEKLRADRLQWELQALTKAIGTLPLSPPPSGGRPVALIAMHRQKNRKSGN